MFLMVIDSVRTVSAATSFSLLTGGKGTGHLNVWTPIYYIYADA